MISPPTPIHLFCNPLFLLFTVDPVLMVDDSLLDIQVGPMILGDIREFHRICSMERAAVKHLINNDYCFRTGQISIRLEAAVRVALEQACRHVGFNYSLGPMSSCIAEARFSVCRYRKLQVVGSSSGHLCSRNRRIPRNFPAGSPFITPCAFTKAMAAAA